MRINPMNTAQFALKPGQVNPMAAALQSAPQYYQQMQKAQQAGIQTQGAKNALAFQNPMLQQALSQAQAQTHIQQVSAAFSAPQAQALLNKANADAGVAQASKQVAISTIGAHVANAKAVTATNQYKAAKAHADAVTAGVGSLVAQKTAGSKISQQASKATSLSEHAKYLPSEVAAKNIAAVTGMANVSASHPYQRSLNPGVIKNVNSAIGGVLTNPLAAPKGINSNAKIPETTTSGKINGYSYTKTRMKNGVKQYLINGHYYSVAAGK